LFGIIILRPTTQGKKVVAALFKQFLASFKLEDVAGNVLVVEFDSIIIRWDCV